MAQAFSFGDVVEYLEPISSAIAGESDYVFMDEVLEVFGIITPKDDNHPRLCGFKVGVVRVPFLRDGNNIMYNPRRIPCRPGQTINITMPTASHASEVSSIETISQLSISEPLQATSVRKSTIQLQEELKTSSETVEIATLSGKKPDATIIQSMATGTLAHKSDRADIEFELLGHKIDKIQLQGDTTQKLIEKVLTMQREALDRLALVQSKAEAILVQNYELLEYTIPRLFIVLPDTTSSLWMPSQLLQTKFRLHFICECGEHTKSNGSKIPHHLHLAIHEGYVIRKPTEFFAKYGPFLLVMLEMIKFGASIAGYVVPVLSTLKVAEITDNIKDKCDSVTTQMVDGVDKSIEYLQEFRDKQMIDEGLDPSLTTGDLAQYLTGVEGLEGVDLRQLETYLDKSTTDRALGNLFRMTTKTGRVKWVCRDHYREGYQESSVQKVKDIVVSTGGDFDEQLAKITIVLRSSVAAEELFTAMARSKGILELDLDLDWNQTNDDLVKLKAMILKSNIAVLRLNLNSFTGPALGINFTASRRYDPIFEIGRHPSLTSFELLGPPVDIFKRVRSIPKEADYSGLRHLSIGPCEYSPKGVALLKSVFSSAHNLSNLILDVPIEEVASVYNILPEQQTCAVEFVGCIRIKALFREQGNVLQDFPQLIEVFGPMVEDLDIGQYGLSDDIAIAWDNATSMSSKLKELVIGQQQSTASSGQMMSWVVARSLLQKLSFVCDEHIIVIIGSIQWQYLRHLDFSNRMRDMSAPLRLMLDSMARYSQPIELESFVYVSMERDDDGAFDVVLQIVRQLSLCRLEVSVGMNGDQITLLLESIDYSRLKYLQVYTNGVYSLTTQGLLDAVPDRAALETYVISTAPISAENIDQMRKRGIELRN
ncbi:hypothetical protein EDD21DRAFT_443337 [Dissophora ornata]|nr:hypothetical protein BGZ58_003776 [Dissophora ornata]KAI8601887.1 hypothetical protein EDD21DRAFT_443337 [Dissophora ornata]